MHRHDVQAAGCLGCPAFRESSQILELNLFRGEAELVRNAHTILDFDRVDCLRADRAAAVALGAVLCDDIDLIVETEGKDRLAVERNRGSSGEPCQGGLASDQVDHLVHEDGREKSAFG